MAWDLKEKKEICETEDSRSHRTLKVISESKKSHWFFFNLKVSFSLSLSLLLFFCAILKCMLSLKNFLIDKITHIDVVQYDIWKYAHICNN